MKERILKIYNATHCDQLLVELNGRIMNYKAAVEEMDKIIAIYNDVSSDTSEDTSKEDAPKEEEKEESWFARLVRQSKELDFKKEHLKDYPVIPPTLDQLPNYMVDMLREIDLLRLHSEIQDGLNIVSIEHFKVFHRDIDHLKNEMTLLKARLDAHKVLLNIVAEATKRSTPDLSSHHEGDKA